MRYSSFVIALLLLLLARVGRSADVTLATPTGWHPSRTALAIRGQDLAIALATSIDGSHTRLMQVRGGSVVFTDLPGSIFGVQFSPSGSHVLVNHAVPSGSSLEGEARSALVTPLGQISWTKAGAASFMAGTDKVFQTSRSAAGPHLVVSNSLGEVRRRFTFDRIPISTLPVGNGDDAIVLIGMTLVKFTASSQGLTTAWRRDLTLTDNEGLSLRPLDTSRFLLEQPFGFLQIISVETGHVLFRFSPCGQFSGASARSLQDNARYQPFPTPDQDRLVLFDGTGSAQLVQISTGGVTAFAIDASSPVGSSIHPQVLDYNLAITDGNGVTIRRLPTLP